MAIDKSLKNVSSCDLQTSINLLKQSCEGSMRIEVRRESVFEDALQEAKKSKVSTTKEIKVCQL